MMLIPFWPFGRFLFDLKFGKNRYFRFEELYS